MLRPRILLSTGLVEALDTAELTAVLVHERRHHLHRRDPLRAAAARPHLDRDRAPTLNDPGRRPDPRPRPTPRRRRRHAHRFTCSRWPVRDVIRAAVRTQSAAAAGTETDAAEIDDERVFVPAGPV